VAFFWQEMIWDCCPAPSTSPNPAAGRCSSANLIGEEPGASFLDSVVVWFDDPLPIAIFESNQPSLQDREAEQLVDAESRRWHVTSGGEGSQPLKSVSSVSAFARFSECAILLR
jgi:hypothetical protein